MRWLLVTHLVSHLMHSSLHQSALPNNTPRIVSARPPLKTRAAIPAKSPDTRRNLYVLGLPFDLSLWVSHFVIGATLQ